MDLTADLRDQDIDRATFEAYLREINHQFTVETYDLINHNCNNFTNTCAEFLLGRGIPEGNNVYKAELLLLLPSGT